MNCAFFKEMKSEKKIFITFLLIHLIVWSVIGLIRVVLPTDTLEGIYWGTFHDFGTPKHPPLACWITYLSYIPFKLDFASYFVSQLFIVSGFIYIYKLARIFLDENKSMLSVIILEGSWCYSYITGYYGFNPDVVLLFVLPAMAYYCYKCVCDNNKWDWVKLGILVGLSFLNKYQTGLVILPMLIWAGVFERKIFKNIFFYLSIVIAFVLFLPHILWLIKYDFYPLLYFENELNSSGFIRHFVSPLMFILMQLGMIGGTLAIFAAYRGKFKLPLVLEKHLDNKRDFWFLILVSFGPLVAHLLLGIITGGTLRARWGYEFWFLTGVLLFYFFPAKTEKKEFVYITKLAYVAMLIIFLALGTLLAVEKNYRSRYPVSKVFGDMQTFWAEKYDTPIKYLGGYIEWTLPITIYAPSHPKAILDHHGYPDPWIKQEELKKWGVMVIDRKYEDVITQTHKACPYLPEDFNIEPIEYKFNVHNAFNMPREYTIYYFIVPPMK